MKINKPFTIALASLAILLGLALSSATARDLYWSEYGGFAGSAVIKASDIDGSNETTIFTGTDMASYIVDIAVTDSHLYWTGHGGGDVWRANRDGSGAGRIIQPGTGLSSVHNLVIDEGAGKIYLACLTNGIFSANLDGSELTPLLYDGERLYSGIEVRSPQEILFVGTNNNLLFSFDPTAEWPSASTRTMEGGNATYGLAYDGASDTVYYTVWGGANSVGSVYSLNLTTNESEQIRSDILAPLGLKLSPDGSHLLIAQRGVGVGAVRLSDGGYQLIAPAAEAHFGVAVTANPELTDPSFPIDPSVIHDVVWTGAAGDGAFGNPLNWDPERVPGFYDRAVFNSGATATVPDGSGITVAGILFDSDEPVLINGLSDMNLLGINFRGGLTVLRGHHTIFGTQASNTSGGLRFVGVYERYIDIAEGASLNLDVRIRHIGTGLQGDPLLGGAFASGETGTDRRHIKIGRGTLIMSKDNGGTNSWNFSANVFTVAEGTWVLGHPRATGLGSANFVVLEGGSIEAPNGITLNAGNIAISGHGVDGSGAIRASGTGSHTGTGQLILNGEASVRVDQGVMFTISRTVADGDGAGVLVKSGEGRLYFPSGNTYSGGTVVQDGVLTADQENSLGTGLVSVQGGVLDLNQNLNLVGDPTDTAYALVWYPSEGSANISHLRIQEGFTGAVLAEKEWGGRFPDADSFGWNGIGETYQLAAEGTYDQEGVLTLTFTLTDAFGFSDSVTALIENPLTGNFFGFGGHLESEYAREFDFKNFSMSVGPAPTSGEPPTPFTAPFTLDFGMSGGQSTGEELVRNRPNDFLLQWDSMQLRAMEPQLTTSTARALVTNYWSGQDFALNSEMILTRLDWPGENRVGFTVLGASESIVSRISLDGGRVQLADGLSFAGIGSTSPLGLRTSADLLAGTAPANQTLIDASWGVPPGGFSDLLNLSIISLAIPPETPPAPVSAWLFDGDFRDAFDGNDGVASGLPAFSSDVPDALSGMQSLNLADGDYLDFGLPENLRLTDEFSAAAWVKTSQSAANRYVFGNYDTRGDGRVWAMIINNGEFRVNISTDGTFTTAGSGIYHSSFNVNTGNWVHLAFTWKEGDLRLFVNGEELIEGEGLVINRSIGFTSLADPSTSSFILGRRDGGTVDSSQYLGLVAEPAIWDTALTPAEVAWVAQNSLSQLNLPTGLSGGEIAFDPFVLSMEYAPGTTGEIIDDLGFFFREAGGSGFVALGTSLAGTDTPWSEDFNHVGQYGIDRERGTVWIVTDRRVGSFGLFTSEGPSEGQTYEAWADAEGIPLEERDPRLDRFGRGIPNLVSFITGIPSSHPAEPLIRHYVDEGRLCFEVPRRNDLAGNAGFQLFSSRDLVHWEQVGDLPWDALPLEDGRSLMKVCLPINLTEDRLFHRIVFSIHP